MNSVKGTWIKGRIVLDEPADWPDGCPVLVEPLSQVSANGESGQPQTGRVAAGLVPDTERAMNYVQMAEALERFGKPIPEPIEPSVDADDALLF